MKDQPAGGHVFNMDGAGADGNATPRFAAYGATKRSLAQVRATAEPLDILQCVCIPLACCLWHKDASAGCVHALCLAACAGPALKALCL